LTAAEIRGLVHLGIRSAMDDLAERFENPLDGVRILAAQQVTWPDASLGCPEPGFSYAQVLTEGIQLLLLYEREKFDYRIAGIHGQLCETARPSSALDSRPLPGIWTRLADMPTSRGEVAAAVLDGKFYVMGGFGRGATAMEEYDPATDTWRNLAPIPRGVDHPAAAGLNGFVYLIGGLDGRWGPVDNVWVYDPEADTWTAKAPLPTARGALAAAALDGKIYAIGGRDATQDLNSVEAYDPANDSWESLEDLPTARDHLAAVVVGERIFAVGGRLTSYARNLTVTEIYNPNLDRWNFAEPLPTARSGIGAATVLGELYVFGGEATEGTFEENESYNPVSNMWETGPPLPTARHGIGVVNLGNRIYVLAGGASPGGSVSALNEAFIVLSGLIIDDPVDDSGDDKVGQEEDSDDGGY